MHHRHIALMLGIALLVSGCGKSETEKKIEATAKNNAEINLRNVVGVMEYCAGKGYLDRKLIDKQKEEFGADLDAETLTLANQAYQQGRKGNLLLRMNRKPKEGEAGGDAQEPETARIDVTFTRTEQQNGELSVFCKRTELWAAREVAAAKQARQSERKQDEKKTEEKKSQDATTANSELILRDDR